MNDFLVKIKVVRNKQFEKLKAGKPSFYDKKYTVVLPITAGSVHENFVISLFDFVLLDLLFSSTALKNSASAIFYSKLFHLFRFIAVKSNMRTSMLGAAYIFSQKIIVVFSRILNTLIDMLDNPKQAQIHLRLLHVLLIHELIHAYADIDFNGFKNDFKDIIVEFYARLVKYTFQKKTKQILDEKTYNLLKARLAKFFDSHTSDNLFIFKQGSVTCSMLKCVKDLPQNDVIRKAIEYTFLPILKLVKSVGTSADLLKAVDQEALGFAYRKFFTNDTDVKALFNAMRNKALGQELFTMSEIISLLITLSMKHHTNGVEILSKKLLPKIDKLGVNEYVKNRIKIKKRELEIIEIYINKIFKTEKHFNLTDAILERLV